METIEDYPKKICFEVFSDGRIKSMNIQVGEELSVSFDIDAREHNGKWYKHGRSKKQISMLQRILMEQFLNTLVDDFVDVFNANSNELPFKVIQAI